ncbi:hypothetical protein D3C78_1521180 [compost metagenome]
MNTHFVTELKIVAITFIIHKHELEWPVQPLGYFIKFRTIFRVPVQKIRQPNQAHHKLTPCRPLIVYNIIFQLNTALCIQPLQPPRQRKLLI